MLLEVVGAIIENDSGEILLAQRPVGKFLAGHWELPGGKVEPGETTAEALERELKEELGLSVRIRNQLGVYDHTYDWGGVRLHVFVVSNLNEPRPTVDVQNFRWEAPNTVELSEVVEADRAPISQYLASLRPTTD